MPELPEVQTVVTGLEQEARGRTILSVQVLRDSIIQNNLAFFKENITNKAIQSLNRKGKYIIFQLSDSFWMIAHLRMTGKFIVQRAPLQRHRHNRIIFELDNDTLMIFNDLRCFGTIELTNDVDKYFSTKKLGYDPWDKHLTTDTLGDLLKTRTSSIKVLLLDQTIIAGLGNIYASEILFRTGIHPFEKGCHLTTMQLQQLIKSTRYILTKAMKYNGTSISDFRRVDDKQGTFQNFLKVYEKEGKPCSRCSTPIVKVKQNQRSTYYCKQCQILNDNS